MARYVANRVAAPALRQHLAVEFAIGTGVDVSSRPSRATESRIFRQHGVFTAADWRKIADLAHRAAGSPPDDAETPDPRSLRARARRYTGRPWREVRELKAWEWVLESALRFGRYPLGSGT